MRYKSIFVLKTQFAEEEEEEEKSDIKICLHDVLGDAFRTDSFFENAN